jgi:hypothetical protein
MGNEARMTTEPHSSEAPAESGAQRYVPLIVFAIAILTLLVIPLKIIGYGYLPIYDDALPDAAKAVSGKSWPEILVLKSSYTMDHHIGWHTLLRWIHLATHCDTEGLVLVSVTALFLVAAWSALPWLRRPEAWLAILVLLVGVDGYVQRFMLGRPFMVSLFALLCILFWWQRSAASPPGWRVGVGMALLIAAAVLLHGIWYFWALPVAAFFLAREFKWGLCLTLSWLAGTILAALITGHPVTYLVEAVQLAFSVIGQHADQRTLVSELQPVKGDWFPLVLLGGTLVLRQVARLNVKPLARNPAFWLACLGWLLGYRASRFWTEWGLPALMVVLTVDLQAFFESRVARASFQRVAWTGALAAALYLTTTSDSGSRWTFNLNTEYLSREDPELAGWLPDKGGILYDVDMFIFYETFFKNPDADWRYMVGNEPALMPEEDFQTYQKILWNNRDPRAYQPWLEKMQPADRLVMRDSFLAPPIPRLEWKHACSLWIGRLPQTNAPAATKKDSAPR